MTIRTEKRAASPSSPPLFALAAALFLLVPPGRAQTPKRVLKLDDFNRIKSIGDPRRSPDRAWVAFTVGSIDAEKDKRDTDVWMVSWDGGRLLRLTTSPDSESAPRWSPDNRFLAFLASRGTEEEKKSGAQVWLLDRGGGEARRLTDIKGGVSDYSWSPDGKRLVFLNGDADPADEPEKLEGWKRKTKPPIVIDRYHFKQDRQGYLQRLYTHVWTFDVAAGKAEQITTGPFEDSSPAWSPDGTKIAFFSRRGADPDRTNDANLYVVEAKPGAEPKALTVFPGPDEGPPSWSPDGRWIAYAQGDEPKMSAYDLSKLAVVASDGSGAPKILTAAFDRPVSGPFLWSADGSHLFFLVDDDRAQYLARIPAGGGAVEKITSGRRTVSNPSASAAGDGAFAILAGTCAEFGEVHALENGALRKLTRQNEDLLAELQLAATEDFTSKSKDGTEVHSLLVKPAGAPPGTRLPLLLIIHGGPNGQDQYSFSFEREFYAANGYAVLAVNYRGSSGRGSAYQKAIFADWGRKEVMDLLGAVDRAVSAGIADPERLGLGGWSYGGILTDYAIATDPRFKAAVSGAGSALQLSMYGSDQYISQYEQEIGPPWKSRDLWLRVSFPFFQANRIKTPTLFLGGEKDFNVPIIGGEQMYQALKSLGVETQLVIYPGQFHGLTIPSYQRDRLQRYLDWFDKFLKPAK